LNNSVSLLFTTVTLLFALSSTTHSQEHGTEAGNRSANARAGAVTIHLGSSAVVIPTPDGFEEASSQFERVRTRFTETEAPGNEMLLVHFTASDCNILRSGRDATMNEYTKVSVLSKLKNQVFSESDLATIVTEFRKNGAAALDPNAPLNKATLDKVEQGLQKTESSNTTLNLTQPVNLGEVEVSPNIYSVMILMTFTKNNGTTTTTTPILASMTFMRVKQRLLYVYCYRIYRARSDLAALRAFSKTWTGQILAAN
jgi:hypothetical protein